MNWRVLLADWRIGVADVCVLCCALCCYAVVLLCCCAVVLCCAVLCKNVPMPRHARTSDIDTGTSIDIAIDIDCFDGHLLRFACLPHALNIICLLRLLCTCYAYVLYLPSVLYQSYPAYRSYSSYSSYPSIILPIKKMRRMTGSKLLAGAIASTVHTS